MSFLNRYPQFVRMLEAGQRDTLREDKSHVEENTKFSAIFGGMTNRYPLYRKNCIRLRNAVRFLALKKA